MTVRLGFARVPEVQIYIPRGTCGTIVQLLNSRSTLKKVEVMICLMRQYVQEVVEGMKAV